MKMKRWLSSRKLLVAPLLILLLAVGGATSFLYASCGPFTDVGTLICPFVLELYYSGITAGTSSTTFSPNDPVTRGQMAVFTSTALDLSLFRGSRRAALGQLWTIPTSHYDAGLGLTAVGSYPQFLKSDGADVWVAVNAGGIGTVSRVRASDGSLLGTWTGATNAYAILVAMGRVFVTGASISGGLYMIDPTQPPGTVTTISNTLGVNTFGVTFDGSNIWTASGGGSVSRITPGTSPGSWTVSTFTAGFHTPAGAIFDGNNVWITDVSQNALVKLNSDGSIAQSVTVGSNPQFPAYDGRNIWVPNYIGSSMTVVRASDGVVLQTFSAANGNQNGLAGPIQASFDGQRILVTNSLGGASLFKAADLSAVGSLPTLGMTTPIGVTSDGLNFWISDPASNTIGRF
jgi:hypothetical protein